MQPLAQFPYSGRAVIPDLEIYPRYRSSEDDLPPDTTESSVKCRWRVA